MLVTMKSFFAQPMLYRRPRQDRGFTLWEIMVVLVIIGLVVAIGFPTMRRSLVRARLLSQANVLKQAVAVARVAALKQGQGVAVRFLYANAEQQGGDVVAWVDTNGSGTYDPPSETMVGHWPVRDKLILKPDPANQLYILGATHRGVLFVGNGSAFVRAGGGAGVGQGAVIVSDQYQNDVRLLVLGGTGTVVQEMRNPETGAWSKELRFWRY